MKSTIVLNTDMTILGTTSWKRAIKLLVKGSAEPVMESDQQIHPTMKIPLVIKLVKAIRSLWKKEVPWSKRGVHTRDGYICQYCGNYLSKKQATVDHVIPVSKGGKNRWENTVCSCFACNNKKNNRTPSEAKMGLIKQPVRPTIMESILQRVKIEGLEAVLKQLGVY